MVDGDGDDEQRAEAVQNETPNDCDMATELIPRRWKMTTKRTERHHKR